MFSKILFKAGLARCFIAAACAGPLFGTSDLGPLASLFKTTNLLPPTEDPFYTPPAGFENEAPGTILRSRPPPAPLTSFEGLSLNLKSVHQILYRTNDAAMEPIATVTTVIVPFNANMSRLVSYQDFEDSSYANCATSYALQTGSGWNTTLSKLDILLEAGMLSNGWVVTLPDFEGPQAAAFSGLENGRATLDGLRAVLASQEITGLAPKENVDYLVWGYSGGSIPTEWAAELAPTYAPELDIKAALVGGAITNLTSTMLTINNGTDAGFGIAGLVRLYNSHPNLTDFLNENLIPEKRDLFFRASKTCAGQTLLDFANHDIGSYFKDGISTLRKPEFAALIESDGAMGRHGVPQIPLFFYKGVADEVSPIADNDKLVDFYCSQGIKSLRYDRNAGVIHQYESSLGLGSALQYITDRFNGVPADSGCVTNNVAIWKPDFSALGGFKSVFEGNIAELLGRPLGLR